MYNEDELKLVIDWQLTNQLPHFKRKNDKQRFLKKYNKVKLKSHYGNHNVYISHKQIIPNESV